MKPEACSSRQKSLRGLAKWAFAAAETRPGLIPQKTTVSPGARTSGTSLRGFRLSGIELVFEERAKQLARDGSLVARPARLEADDPDDVVAAGPVAAGVALGLAQRSQPLHGSHRMCRTGRHGYIRAVAVTAKTFSYAVSLDRGGDARSDDGGPVLEHDEAWSPEHLVLTGLARCTLTSLRYHAKRIDVTVGGSAEASGTVTQRDTDGRYAFVRIKVDLDVTLEPAPASVRELLSKAERDCFVGASLTARPRYRWTVNGEEIA